VEIKCQLDATDEFLLQILLLAQHVSGNFMPIIRSSRVLYKWLLSVTFGAWFSSCRYSVELRVVCPVCGLLQQPANRTHKHVEVLLGTISITYIVHCLIIYRKYIQYARYTQFQDHIPLFFVLETHCVCCEVGTVRPHY
jgi:hypothetical protein